MRNIIILYLFYLFLGVIVYLSNRKKRKIEFKLLGKEIKRRKINFILRKIQNSIKMINKIFLTCKKGQGGLGVTTVVLMDSLSLQSKFVQIL